MVEKELSLFYLVAWLLLSYGGYGPTKLLIPSRLGGFGPFVMPLVGYSFLAIFSSYANLFLNMTWGTWAFLALATVINGYAFFKGGSGVPLSWSLVVVWGFALLSYILGVLPLIHAGSTAFVGLQWDLEIYLPFTEYLKSYPIGAALVGPPENPLISYLNSPAFRGGSGWGFSYMEAALGALLGWESFETFRPSLQFVLSLSVPSIYVFCRAVLGMSQRASLLAAGLWALNGLSLWVASMGLAGHVVSFFALPLALTATHWALEAPSRRTVILAGFVLAGLLLSFYTGALPMYVLPVAALVALKLVMGPKRGRTFLVVLGVAGAVGVFALVGHLRFLEVVPAFRSLGFSQGWRIQTFSPLSEPLGLSPYAMVAERVPPEDFLGSQGAEAANLLGNSLPWALFSVLLLSAYGGGRAMRGLASRPSEVAAMDGWNWRAFLAMAVFYGGFLFYLRAVSPYPYGYFKALSLGSFFLVAGMGQGIVALWAGGLFHPSFGVWIGDEGSGPKTRWVNIAARGLLGTFGALLIPLLLFNTFLSIRYFWDPDPQELPRQVWELEDLRRVLPKGAEVYISRRSGYDPRLAGMVAYFLRDNPLVGSMKTGYGELSRFPPGQRYSYLLLQEGEDPRERGLTEGDLVWRNDLVSLYRGSKEWIAVLELEDMGQAFPLPREHRLVEVTGEDWMVTTDKGVWKGNLPQGASQLQGELSLLLFSPETLVVEMDNQRYSVSLPPGLVSYRTPTFSVLNILRIERERLDPPLWLLGVRISLLGEETQVYTAQNLFAISPSLSFDGEETRLSLDYLTAELRGGHLTLALELYSSSTGAEPARAWELAQIKGQAHGRKEIIVDLSAGDCEAVPEGGGLGPVLSLPSALAMKDEKGLEGEYEAQLAVYYVGGEIARWPWFTVGALQGSASGRNPGITGQERRSLLGFPFFTSYLPIPKEARQAVGLIPPGEGVYFSPKADPDRSFIPVAAYLLARRGGYLSAEERPPVYALLWRGDDPEQVGFREEERIWEGQEAVLYRRSGEAATSKFIFSGYRHGSSGSQSLPSFIGPGESIAVRIEADKVSLTFPGGQSSQPRGKESGEYVVEVLAASPEPLPLVLETAEGRKNLSAPAGVFLLRLPLAGAGQAPFVRVHNSGIAPLLVRSVMVEKAAAGPPPAGASSPSGEVIPMPGQFYARTRGLLDGDMARVRIDYIGPHPGEAYLAIDVYKKGPCRPAHYGWWAIPLASASPGMEFSLDLAGQKGRMVLPTGEEVPLGFETWPMGGGDYRAFLQLKYRDEYLSLPVFEFSIGGGKVVVFDPYDVNQVASLPGK